MMPEWHTLLGAAFCLTLYPVLPFQALLIIFIATIAIDIDHYVIYIIKKQDWSLWKAYNFFKKAIKQKIGKSYFCFFHTIEFILALAFLSFFNKLAFYFLVGFVFHLLVDLGGMLSSKERRKELSIVFFSVIARAKAKAW